MMGSRPVASSARVEYFIRNRNLVSPRFVRGESWRCEIEMPIHTSRLTSLLSAVSDFDCVPIHTCHILPLAMASLDGRPGVAHALRSIRRSDPLQVLHQIALLRIAESQVELPIVVIHHVKQRGESAVVVEATLLVCP